MPIIHRSGTASWLRAHLRTARSFTAFVSDVDEDGLALLSDALAGLLARDGRVRIVVPSARARVTVSQVLGLGGEAVVVDVVSASGANVYVLGDNNGTYRAYLGSTPLTLTGLSASGPGVVLDMRQDADDARSMQEALTRRADTQLAEAVAGTPLVELMQPVMDHLAGREGRDAQQQPTFPSPTESTGVPGLPTGSVDLDKLTGGLLPGELWVVTGRSGAGKSVFVLGLARTAAVGSRARTALLSLRGSEVETAMMLLSAEARVPLHYLRFGGLVDDDWARLARRIGEIAEAPLFLLAAEPGTQAEPATPKQRIVQSRDVAARHDLALLIVDDIPASVSGQDLLELKAVAMKAGVCVVAVLDEDAQLPLTEVERAASLISDLLVRVDREHDMTPRAQSERAGEADLHVLRHRRGPVAVISLAFQGHYARFAEMPPRSAPGPWA